MSISISIVGRNPIIHHDLMECYWCLFLHCSIWRCLKILVRYLQSSTIWHGPQSNQQKQWQMADRWPDSPWKTASFLRLKECWIKCWEWWMKAIGVGLNRRASWKGIWRTTLKNGHMCTGEWGVCIVSHFVTKHRMYIRIGIQVWLSKATLIGGLSLPTSKRWWTFRVRNHKQSLDGFLLYNRPVGLIWKRYLYMVHTGFLGDLHSLRWWNSLT